MITKTIHPTIALVLVCLVALGASMGMILFPLHSGKTVWTGYRVLIVSPASSEAEIVSRLNKAKITAYATEANSLLSNSSPEAPIQPYLTDLNSARARWFSDSEHDLRFVYLKNAPFLDGKVRTAFSGSTVYHYLERNAGTTRIQALALIILLVAGLILRPNRLFQLFCAVPCGILALIFCRVTGFLSSVALLLGIIALCGSVNARGMKLSARQVVRILAKKRRALLLIPVALILASLSGFHGFLLAFLSIAASVALTVPAVRLRRAARALLSSKRIHPHFEPVAISGDSLVTRESKGYALEAAALLSAALGVGLLLLMTPSLQTGESRVLYIPAPTRYTHHAGFGIEGYSELQGLRSQTAIPDLGDFVAAQWIIRTAPWRRIQDPVQAPVAGSSADYVWYQADEAGIITGKKRTMFTFNSGFIRKTLDTEGTLLERMLLRQNRFVTVELTRLK
jgi:hypothetical protein